MSAGRYWMRLSRFLTILASSSTLQAARLPRPFFMFAQTPMPPSADGLAKRAPKSLRKTSGRKPGRPKGQLGATLQLTDHPDHVVRHEPAACRECGARLEDAALTGMERRQVTEIPPVRAEVTEHQMIEKECPCCGERTKAAAPTGVTAPVRHGYPRRNHNHR